MPLVSVIIPTHDRAELVIHAIESVLGQTYGKLEAIVVDDGSADDTAKAVATSNDDRVRYIRIPHSGLPAVARNAGLRIAQGEYVAFLDSDDLWYPEKLALQVACFARSPEVGLVCSNALRLREAEDVRGARSELYLKPGQGHSGRVLEALLRDNFVIASTAMVRRACLEQAGVFDESPSLLAGEDYDLWLRVAAIAEVRYLDQPLAAYRESGASVRSRQRRDQHWLGMIRIVEKLERGYPEAMQKLQPTVRMALATCHRGLSDHYCAQGRRAEACAHAVTALRLRPSQLSSYTCLVRSLLGRRPVGIVRALVERHRSTPESSAREMPEDGKVRLHLGCGEVYLPGYINVDLPAEDHTVQQKTKADRCADITQLEFAEESIAEIRLHHVFEHFDRPTALRLLVDWYVWLEDGGTLIIETPDFEQSARQILSEDLSTEQKMVILRHVFGSHEAEWAFHRDGWYRDRFELVLHALGFNDLQFEFSKWGLTANITVTAKKRRPFRTWSELQDAVYTLLKQNLVDDSDSEKRVLKVWIDKLDLRREAPGSQ
jgi:GT2 family glycosyltransferase